MSEDPHNLDDSEADPPAHSSTAERLRAVELARATELITSLSSDIAQIARIQDLGRGQLDEVVHQVTYLRQLMDYSLFVTPDQITQDGELYPVLAWLRDQLSYLQQAVSDNAAITQATTGAQTDDAIGKVREAILELEDRLRTSMESHSVRLVDGIRYLAAAEEMQQHQTDLLKSVLEYISVQPSPSDSQAIQELVFGLEGRIRAVLEAQSVRQIDSIRYLAVAEELQQTQLGLLQSVLERVSEQHLSPELPELPQEALADIRSAVSEAESRLGSSLQFQSERFVESAQILAAVEQLQQQQLQLLRSVLDRVAQEPPAAIAVLPDETLNRVCDAVGSTERAVLGSLEAQKTSFTEAVKLLRSIFEQVSKEQPAPVATLPEETLNRVCEAVVSAERSVLGSLESQNTSVTEAVRHLEEAAQRQQQLQLLLRSVLEQVSHERPMPTPVVSGEALAGVCDTVISAEERVRGSIESQSVRLIDSIRYLAAAEERQQQLHELLQAVLERVTEQHQAAAPAISEEALAGVRDAVTSAESRLRGSLESQSVRLVDSIRYLAAAEERQQQQQELLHTVLERVGESRVPEVSAALPEESLDRIRGIVGELEGRLRGSFESQSVRLIDNARFLAAAEEMHQQQWNVLQSVAQAVSEAQAAGITPESLEPIYRSVAASEERLQNTLERQGAGITESVRYLATAEELQQQQLSMLQAVFQRVTEETRQNEQAPVLLAEGAFTRIRNELAALEHRLTGAQDAQDARQIESIRYLVNAEEQQQQQLQLLRELLQHAIAGSPRSATQGAEWAAAVQDKISGSEKRVQGVLETQGAKQIEAIRYLHAAEEQHQLHHNMLRELMEQVGDEHQRSSTRHGSSEALQHEQLSLLQALLQRVTEEKLATAPVQENSATQVAEVCQFLEAKLNSLQVEVTHPLESLNLRMIDAFRVLAVMEDEQRSRVENEDGMVQSLTGVLSSGIEIIGQNIKGLFESINIRLVDQTRYLATAEAKQREQLIAIRKLLEDRTGKPTFAGLRNSLGMTETGGTPTEVHTLLHSLKSGLDAIQGQLTEHTRQLAAHDAQQQSHLNAVRGMLGTNTQQLPQHSIPDPGVASGLELIHLQLVDTMRFLAKIEDQQRQAIMLVKDRAAAPQGTHQRTLEPDEERETSEELLASVADILEEKTSRWGVQQHVFYGLVILLLLINMGLLCWLNVAH